jgi:hypothetical protein
MISGTQHATPDDNNQQRKGRTMSKRITKRLTSTAYHEAGHAVAHYLLKRPFKYVTIKPEEGSLGHLMPCDLPLSLREVIEFGEPEESLPILEKLIMINFAGNAAIAIWTGRNNWQGARGDFQNIAQQYCRCCRSPDEETAFLKWLSIRTRNLIGCSLHWPVVEAVAQALLTHERLTSRQVKEIAIQCFGGPLILERDKPQPTCPAD